MPIPVALPEARRRNVVRVASTLFVVRRSRVTYTDAHMTTSYDRAQRVGLAVARLGAVFGWESDDFVEEAVALVLAGQIEQVLSTWSYLADSVELLDPFERILDVDAPVDVLVGSATHDGTPLEMVYRRPGILAADLTAEGLASSLVRSRVESEVVLMASADVSVAGRKAEQAYGLVDRRVVGTRRVPNVGACKWCRHIATQRYKKERLAPAHRGCACGTEPIVAPGGPGRVADPVALAEIKANGVPTRYGQRQADARQANRAIATEEETS
jgi:hypothetical protein